MNHPKIYSCWLLLGLISGCAAGPDSPAVCGSGCGLRPLLPAKTTGRPLNPASYTYYQTHWQPLEATAESWPAGGETVVEEVPADEPAATPIDPIPADPIPTDSPAKPAPPTAPQPGNDPELPQPPAAPGPSGANFRR